MRILVTTCAVIGALALSSGMASAQNSTYCANQATAYAKKVANPVVGGVGGGVVGAVAGIIAGEVLGQGKGAKAAGGIIGGTAGAALGASSQKKKFDQAYNEEYYRCMNAVPAAYNIPAAGSPAWTYQCSLKYKSFREYDGTFQPYRPYAGAPLPPRQVCILP